MAVNKKGATLLPNQRAINSLLPRVNGNMELDGFHRAVAKKFGGQVISLSDFTTDWNEIVLEHLDGTDWFDWAVDNFGNYVNVLVSRRNAVFAMTLISRYNNDPSLRPVSRKLSRKSQSDVSLPVADPAPIDIPTVEPPPTVEPSPTSGIKISSPTAVTQEVEIEVDESGKLIDDSDAVADDDDVIEEVQSGSGDKQLAEVVSITQDDYNSLVGKVRKMDKIADLREFADTHQIEVGGTSKQGVRDQIIDELSNRVE